MIIAADNPLGASMLFQQCFAGGIAVLCGALSVFIVEDLTVPAKSTRSTLSHTAPKPDPGRRLSSIEKADIALAQSIALPDDTVIGKATARLANLGDQPPMRTLCGVAIATGIMRHDLRLFRTGLRMLTAHSLATLAKAFVKDGIDRTRPGDAMHKGKYKMEPGFSDAHRLQSMPSGHSAGIVAVAASAVSEYPEVGAPALFGSITLVAAQLPSRNHYLSDVIAGSAIGLGSFALTQLLLPALGNRPSPQLKSV